ncbi:MAG: hypothetical protein HYR88_17685 [Verrucomicrobia bacterium]|nr:hypothetical protein [Verrucomicrobiota bacterium]MBI3867444.1 hypothetical protein [Verrucomicrobiota bacterium]
MIEQTSLPARAAWLSIVACALTVGALAQHSSSRPAALGAIPADYQGKPFADSFHKAGPPSIPGIVQCALYDLGGEGVAYHDTTPVNEGSDVLNRQVQPNNHQRAHADDYVWHFRAKEGVDVSYIKDWADLNHTNAVNPPINLFYIGWTADDEWVNYTVNVKEPGTYAVKCLYSYAEKEVHRDANGKMIGEISFALNGKPAALCRLPRATPGWHYWDYGQIATITFPDAGPQLLTFHYRRGNNWAYFVFERLETKSEDAGLGK